MTREMTRDCNTETLVSGRQRGHAEGLSVAINDDQNPIGATMRMKATKVGVVLSYSNGVHNNPAERVTFSEL